MGTGILALCMAYDLPGSSFWFPDPRLASGIVAGFLLVFRELDSDGCLASRAHDVDLASESVEGF